MHPVKGFRSCVGKLAERAQRACRWVDVVVRGWELHWDALWPYFWLPCTPLSGDAAHLCSITLRRSAFGVSQALALLYLYLSERVAPRYLLFQGRQLVRE